ncbi:hypothetical protein WJX75_002584 [Coccomyxa subellipsoidea]|uniref:Beach-domain-containing protein n=1 Tax=Coccomyxa subellipsoidea TaxID=248742 RepID=A0ABR2YHW0_9CHLO
MALLRRLIKGTLFTRAEGAVEEDNKEVNVVTTQEGLIDILYDESHTEEAELSWLFREYEQAQRQDANYCKEALRKFFVRFTEVYEPWLPEEIERGNTASPPLPPMALHRTLSSPTESSLRAHQSRDAHYHRGQHEALHRIPEDLAQVTGWESAATEELEGTLGLVALDVLRIASRSRHNRALLLQLGVLPGLTRLMKVAISRLHALADKDNGGAALWFLQCLLAHVVSAVDTFVTGEVRAVTGARPDIVEMYLSQDARFCSRQAKAPGNVEESEAVERALAPLLEEGMLQHLLDLLCLLRLLRSRGAAVPAPWEVLVLDLLLALVSASGHAQTMLLGSDPSRRGLVTLLEGIGWPRAAPNSQHGTGSAAGYVLKGGGQRSVEAELRVQLMTLQVVAAAIHGSTANLQAVQDAGGFERITQLLQWAALTFPKAPTDENGAALPQQQQLGSRSSQPVSPRVPHSPFPASPRMLAEDSIPTCSPRGLGESAVPASFPSTPARHHSEPERCSSWTGRPQFVDFRGGASLTPPVPPWALPGGGGAPELGRGLERRLSAGGERAAAAAKLERRSLSARLERRLSVGHLYASRSSNDRGSASNSLQGGLSGLVPWSSSDWQSKLRRTLRTKLDAEPEPAVEARPLGPLSQAGLPALPSPPLGQAFAVLEALLDLAERRRSHSELSSASQAHRDRLLRSVVSAVLGAFKAVMQGCPRLGPAEAELHAAALSELHTSHSALQMHSLRFLERVVAVDERAACLEGPDGAADNQPEVHKLLELLEKHALEPEVVLLAAPALARVLMGAQQATMAALDRSDGLTLLAAVVTRQAQADTAAQGPQSQRDMHASGGGDVHFSWQARCAILSALATYLHASPSVQRAAVRKWEPVAALFGLLWDDSTRKIALSMVVGLMRLTPVDQDDRLAKAALFTKYAELLPAALVADSADAQRLVSDLLLGIREVIAGNKLAHQNLFRQSECFVQVVNLLNFNYEGGHGARLCEEVLATITALLAGNDASRRRLVSDVGYDQILTAVMRQTPEEGPQQSLLLSILGLILEADYDPSTSEQIIKNAEAVPLFFHFLQMSEIVVQTWGLDAIWRLTSGSMPNLSACERCGLNAILIEWFAAAREQPELQQLIAALLQVTGAYSISGRDLRAIFALLRKDGSCRVPSHAVVLLRSLAVMAHHQGPTTFFDFANEGAGIVRNTPLRFPGSKGYSFATWLRLEDADAQPGTAGRALFTLLHKTTEATRGVSAAFKGSTIAVRSLGAKTSEAQLEFRFEAKRWYHVVLTHSTGSALAPAWVRLFVNGTLEASERFKYPKVQEPLNSCSIAARLSGSENGLGVPINAFHGQMGCIYLFEDILSPAQVGALHALGPDYQSTFSPLESDAVLEQMPAAAALVVDGKEALGPRLMISYNAQAAAGRMLYNTADMERGGAGDGDTVAILEGTQLCCTRQLRDLLHCLGGVSVLLPLFAQLDAPSSEDGQEASRAVDVVRLLGAVLADSPHNRQSMVQISGVALVAHLLQQRSPKHLTLDLLHALEALLRAVAPAEALHTAVLQRLLLNLRLWAAAPLPIQRSFQALLLKLAKGEPGGVSALLGVPRLLDAMRAHYGGVASADAARPPAGAGGLLPAELRALRQGLLNVALSLLHLSAVPSHKAPRIAPHDVQALISFIGDCSDVATLEDVLIAILDLLRHTPPGRIPLLAGSGGAQLFLSLLSREQPALRILGLHLLAYFVPYMHAKGAESEEALAGFWAAVADALLMFPLTPTVRESLLQLLCANAGSQAGGAFGISMRGRSGHVVWPDARMPITAAPVVGILLQLLLGCDDAGQRSATLEALHKLIVEGSRENRAAVVAQEGWEQWLLELLLDGSPCIPCGATTQGTPERLAPGSGDDEGHAPWVWVGAEAVVIRSILRALHGYCITELPIGWTALERTACHLRAYADRGVVDGWGLMHSLLADVVDDIVGAASSEANSAAVAERDAWTLIASLSTELARDNCMGVLDLIDELTSGTLIMPRGLPLNPTPEAVAWAEGGVELVPVEAWPVLGVPGASAETSLPVDAYMTAEAWRLHSGAWQLIYVLQKSADGFGSSLSWDSRAQSAGSSRARRVSDSGNDSAVSSPRGLNLGSSNSLADAGNGKIVSEEIVRAGIADRVVRLTVRMVLTALRCAAPSVASDCVASGCRLLPTILTSSTSARVHLLLACMVKLNARLRTGKPGPLGHARQLALAKAAHDVNEVARNALPSDVASFPTLPGVHDGHFWEKVRQGINWTGASSAARNEVLFLSHMAAAHSSAMQLLDREGEARLLTERTRRTAFLTNAREALGSICATEKSRRAAARVAHEEESQALARTWRNLQRSLSGERGLWMDPDCAEPPHWKLDKFEDPSRRRLKLKRNYKFQMYSNPLKGPPVQPTPGNEAALNPHLALPGVKMKGPADDFEDFDEMGSPQSSLQMPSSSSLESQQRDEAEGASAEAMAEDERDAENAVNLKEEAQVIFSTSCQLVTPKHVVAGTLRLTNLHLQFVGDPPSEEQPLPGGTGAEPRSAGAAKPARTHKRWPVSAITELHHARFLLQQSALEIFLADRSNALLNFDGNEAMMETAEKVAGASPRIAVFDRKRKIELALKLQQRWQRWELTNFDYLMQLNTLAGRTYNDLNQYPVFPWILADYTSASLDLNSPAAFRDLSKPVGALNEKRLHFFRERYDSLQADPDVPPFHYGSHYSAAGVVLFYLIRQEPFTGLNRSLQGGRFDHADRLFSSVPAAWSNCLVNTSDVKELTPEFFYLPDFLTNADGFCLGTRQDGRDLDDVELPPWAKGSPDEFVRLQREALECDHVSEHLHEWIDLIFGYKQRGRAAEAAANVFYYLTYEGAVDLDDIVDARQRKAVEDQISHFGQTPSQLFRRRHPRRGAPPPPTGHPLLNGPDAMKLTTVGMPPSRRPNIAVARVEVTEGRVVLVNADRAVSTHRWLSPRDAGAFTFSVPAEAGFGVEADPNPPRLMGAPFAADIHAGHCYAILPGGQVIASCGYWDNSIRCYSSEEGRLLQSIRQHKDIVTCIEAGSDGCTLATGSKDTTVIVWDIVGITRTGRLRARMGQAGAAAGGLPLRQTPRHVLHGHEDAVTCLTLAPDLDLIVSAAADGTLLFHTLATGRYVRKMRLAGGAPPVLLAVAPGPGMLVVHSWADLGLHVFNVNGRHLVSADGNERLAALAISPDGHFLLTGGQRGIASLHWLHSLECVVKYDGGRGPITALSVSAEECVVAGTQGGALLVFSPDPRRRMTRRLQLADAREGPCASPATPSPSKTLKFDA